MRAERDVSVRLSLVHADGRLEPLAVGVHQADQRDRRAADLRGERGEVVERLLGLGVENLVAPQGFEARKLVRGGFGAHRLVCPIGSTGAPCEPVWRASIVEPARGFASRITYSGDAPGGRPSEYLWQGQRSHACDAGAPRSAGAVEERTEPRISELSADGLTWVHADRPGALEVSYLAERFGFHELDIEDVLSKRQRPKIDEYPDYLFVVLHFPFYDKTVRRLNAAELDVFLGPDFLITLPNVRAAPRHAPLPRAARTTRSCARSSSRRARATCSTTSSTTSSTTASRSSTRSAHKLDAIEPAIFEERSEDVVRDISNAKQEIIAYRKIIKPERATLRLLERSSQRFLPEDLELYFDDIVDASERIWDLLDNYKEVIEGLESTNEAFISHKQQYRLQLLTVVTVISCRSRSSRASSA